MDITILSNIIHYGSVLAKIKDHGSCSMMVEGNGMIPEFTEARIKQ